MKTGMKYSKLYPFGLGELTASGWTKEQLERNRDGIGGHLDELEPLMMYTPYTERRTETNWGGPGWGAEISGNYWYGLIVLAFTLDDEGLKKKAENWVNAVLAAREEDGYMGAYAKTDDRFHDYNAWGTACGMRAMLAYYDATGREDVFDAVNECMLWFCRNWRDHKTAYAGNAITEVMLYCYAKNGDERLLEFSKNYDTFMTADNTYLTSTESLESDEWVYNSDHTVNYGTALRRPLALYGATGDKRYLEAARHGLMKLRRYSMQLSGAPIGNDEWLSPVSMVGEAETCSFAVYGYAYAMYSQLDWQDGEYGDYWEEMVFNAAQGARKKDERAIAYMTIPNQLECSEASTSSHIWANMYAPCVPTSCCPVYSVHVIPDYVRHMILHDGRGNLTFDMYGPCELNSGDWALTVDTLYPFRGEVKIKIHKAPGEKKSIAFKIPGWSTDSCMKLNGAPISVREERVWAAGDEIVLNFGMEPEVVEIDDCDGGDKQPLALRCGPLVYVLSPGENWKAVGNGYARTPLPEGWTWYSVFPKDIEPRLTALDFNTAAATVKYEELEPDGYVWENPPVRLTLDGYRAPWAYAKFFVHQAKECYGKRVKVTGKKPLELIPYGCTALRITYFPRADI
ncbi:MAG: hypothetical protein GX628_03280 [Clostridiales bacterium]|nr:hypothetical protein [Clostridiales bacterium]